MEYYSVLKANELWSHKKKLNILKYIWLNKASNSELNEQVILNNLHISWFQVYDMLEKAKNMETIK